MPFTKKMAEHKRVRVRLSGRVQGVGFRFFTQQQAYRLALSGWVRNLPNGDVEAEAQGVSEQVDLFVEAVKRGPVAARVTDVQVIDVPVVGSENGFEVRMF